MLQAYKPPPPPGPQVADAGLSRLHHVYDVSAQTRATVYHLVLLAAEMTGIAYLIVRYFPASDYELMDEQARESEEGETGATGWPAGDVARDVAHAMHFASQLHRAQSRNVGSAPERKPLLADNA
jgi:hypothetical protein